MINITTTNVIHKLDEFDDSNKLVIGPSFDYPPHEIIAPDETLTKFDIEYGNALAKQKGYDTIQWGDGNFDGLIGELQAKSIDLAIAGLSPDPKRQAIF